MPEPGTTAIEAKGSMPVDTLGARLMRRRVARHEGPAQNRDMAFLTTRASAVAVETDERLGSKTGNAIREVAGRVKDNLWEGLGVVVDALKDKKTRGPFLKALVTQVGITAALWICAGLVAVPFPPVQAVGLAAMAYLGYRYIRSAGKLGKKYIFTKGEEGPRNAAQVTGDVLTLLISIGLMVKGAHHVADALGSVGNAALQAAHEMGPTAAMAATIPSDPLHIAHNASSQGFADGKDTEAPVAQQTSMSPAEAGQAGMVGQECHIPHKVEIIVPPGCPNGAEYAAIQMAKAIIAEGSDVPADHPLHGLVEALKGNGSVTTEATKAATALGLEGGGQSAIIPENSVFTVETNGTVTFDPDPSNPEKFTLFTCAGGSVDNGIPLVDTKLCTDCQPILITPVGLDKPINLEVKIVPPTVDLTPPGPEFVMQHGVQVCFAGTCVRDVIDLKVPEGTHMTAAELMAYVKGHIPADYQAGAPGDRFIWVEQVGPDGKVELQCLDLDTGELKVWDNAAGTPGIQPAIGEDQVAAQVDGTRDNMGNVILPDATNPMQFDKNGVLVETPQSVNDLAAQHIETVQHDVFNHEGPMTPAESAIWNKIMAIKYDGDPQHLEAAIKAAVGDSLTDAQIKDLELYLLGRYNAGLPILSGETIGQYLKVVSHNLADEGKLGAVEK